MQSSPLFIAKECQRMAGDAKGGDSMAFQKGAMCLMGAMVVASVAGVLLQIWKEWKHTAPPAYKQVREDLDDKCERHRSR